MSAELRERAVAEGVSRGATAIDYFVFTAGLFDPVPPFVVGRARFDNWLVWRGRAARHRRRRVTQAVVAVHQRHDYAHVPEASTRRTSAPRRSGTSSWPAARATSTRSTTPRTGSTADGRLRRNLGATGRVRENARKIAWKLVRADVASACVSRPRLLVLNQYYRPGVEATANLLADLCESLAADYEVTVVTGRLQGREELPTDETAERCPGACGRGRRASTGRSSVTGRSTTPPISRTASCDRSRSSLRSSSSA